MRKIELLAPAGSVEALNAAAGAGADAVYLGLKGFNARMRSANFTFAQFENAARGLRRAGRRLYVAVNTVFEQREADRMYQTLKYLSDSSCDGIIVQDFGVLRMARAYFPSLKVHSSTQMNIASSRAVNVLSKEGVTRAVLARELCFEEIKAIRENTNIELEIFAHGALCVSVSGLCLFSSYLGGKSANRGMCTQACRRLYSADNNEKGYYFSPHDLQLLERIPHLVEAGVDSFKIEGRMKSAGYVGCVVGAYRAMLDAVLEGGTDADANVKAAALLKNDFARQKTIFHFDGRESANAASWLNPAQDGGTGVRLGRIDRTRADGGVIFALIKPVSEFSGTDAPASGDSIRIHRADDSERSAHKIKRVEYNADGSFWIDIPAGFSVGDNVYLISKKETSRRCRPVAQNSDDGKGGSRRPGFEKAPYEKIPAVKRSTKNDFPEGLYVSVSRIEDMYAAQSVKPALIIISASVKVINRLTGEKKALPFSPAETVLSLPPFFAENSAASYEAALPKLIEAGYSRYMINNLAHISLLKNKNVLSICGPYLYTFNRAAVSFLAGHQLRFFVTPLENNRQNLERTFTEEERGGVFVTVFAYPRLFRICGVNGFYDFGEFSDSRGEQFKLVNEDETSSVIPAKPFSIIDKIPFLKRSGFRRFIIDFSGEPLLKQRYKNIMKAANNCSLVDGASRFNWKDGFFTTED